MTDCIHKPSVEFRIPISANEKFLRMLHYLLESLRVFGGELAANAKSVVTVSRDEPYRDLLEENPWLGNYAVEIHWMDESLFSKYEYDGTGMARLSLKSQADIVILCDADILVAGDLGDVILESFAYQKQLGFIAHVSPFDRRDLANVPSEDWWRKIFFEADLPCPALDQKHTGWQFLGHLSDSTHSKCPYYFNYGFIVSPRRYIEQMGKTFESDLEVVDRVLDTWYKSQIVNTISYSRHGIPCGTLSVNYNFPLHVPEALLRAANPDPRGRNSPNDIRVFHYLGAGEFNKEDFQSANSVNMALNRNRVSQCGKVFQEKLRYIHERIGNSRYGIASLRGSRSFSRINPLHQLGRTRKGARGMVLLSNLLKASRRMHFGSRFMRKHPGLNEQFLIRLIDVYSWALKYFDEYCTSFFQDQSDMEVFFQSCFVSLIPVLKEDIEGRSRVGWRGFDSAVDRIRALFPETEQIFSNQVGNDPLEGQVGTVIPELYLVCGGRRTGTTLLNAILSSDEKANSMGQEAQILTRLLYVYQWAKQSYPAFGHPSANASPTIRDRFNAILIEFIHRAAKAAAKNVLILKNPEFSLVIHELHEAFPQATILATVRDPRDQVASELEVGMRRTQELKMDLNYLVRNVDSLSNNYLHYVTPLLDLNHKVPGRIHFVKYETLVTNPRAELERIRLLTGLSICQHPDEVWRNVSSTAGLQSTPSRSPLYGKPIQSSSINRYRRDLSKAEIHLVEDICSPIMQHFHYTSVEAGRGQTTGKL